MVYLFQRLLNYLVFLPFNYIKRTLFKKRVMHTKSDIYDVKQTIII